MAEAAVLAGLGWLASPVISKFVNKSISYLGTDIAKGLDDLETTLLPQIAITIKAAQNSHPDHKALLSRWVARLKNAYYDAEGILHNLEYERLKRNSEGIIHDLGNERLKHNFEGTIHEREEKKLLVHVSPKLIFKPLAKFIDRVRRFSCKPIIKPLAKFAVKKTSLLSPQQRKLLQRLNKLKKVAEEAKTFRDLLGIQNTENNHTADNNPCVTSSLLGNADKVFGRDKDRDEIIKFLLNEQGGSSSTKSYSVVAVTGMGGVGKTTLAQYVYNNKRVEQHFGVRMWLCLSQNIDIKERTKEMIECASGEVCPNLLNFNKLQNKLIETLTKSDNILVVLDDVRFDNNVVVGEEQWENFLKPLDSRQGACKIVVTSRSSRLFPEALKPRKLIELRDLAHADFRSLLRYRTIDNLQLNNPQLENDLSKILDQIATKMCKSPLAAKVVGKQLSDRPEILFWKSTLEKVDLSKTSEILLWSFHRFNVHLQRCFLFCSVFPQGTRHFGLRALVPYWVALDFIQPSDDNRDVEDIGLEYFEIMIANSIFQLVDKSYIMHDLFHDLAEKLSTEDCFRIKNVEGKIPSTVVHVYLKVNNENLKETLSSLCNLSNLRTLILGNPFIDDISEIITIISTNFRNLRVLDICSKGYKILPRVIGDFRNLRLLSFWENSIEELPDSISQLYHLQFLWLPSSVETLPTKLSNLIKLRRIEMRNSDGLPTNTLPPVPYLGKLTSLQGLDEFHVKNEEGYELQQLGPLKEIGGSLRIVNLENVRYKNEAVEARLINKPKLKRLELVWVESDDINGLEKEVIEALHPSSNLELLKIDGYRGSMYPTLLQEGSSREGIEVVRFYNCNALTMLPSNFHQFRYCSELDLHNLEVLRELSTFPDNLVRLSIINCPRLIFVCENKLQVNKNQTMMDRIFLKSGHEGLKDILNYELKSFEQTCSIENCKEEFQIIQSTTQGNALIVSVNQNVIRAWWGCHQQRMNFILRCKTQALKLPSRLRVLYLGYCCVSDGVLSDCLRGNSTLEELYLWGIMTLTTLPPAQVLKSLQSLRSLEIKHCWCLRSLGGLHALPHLQHFEVEGCLCLKMAEGCLCLERKKYCLCLDTEKDNWRFDMKGGYTSLPPTLQSLYMKSCTAPQAIFNGNLPSLQHVRLSVCIFPSSLSFCQLTSLKTLHLSLAIQNPFSGHEGFELSFLPNLDLVELLHLPDLEVKSIVKSCQSCLVLLISDMVILNKLLSFQDFVPPPFFGFKFCQEEEISIQKSDHLQSIKVLFFIGCEIKNLPKTMSDFSTLEEINIFRCPKISELPELPSSVQGINIRGCPVLKERCQPNGLDWHKIKSIERKCIE